MRKVVSGVRISCVTAETNAPRRALRLIAPNSSDAAAIAGGTKVAGFTAFFSVAGLMAGWTAHPGACAVLTRGLWKALYVVTVASMIIGNIGAGIQTLFGGNISLLQQLCERARQEAFMLMMQHAAEHGANAVVGMRYDANEVMSGVTEVLAYGTAVVIEKI